MQADASSAARAPRRSAPLLGDRTGEVSPLELFFDLVFVFAVSQLSEHLVAALSWRGAGETAVLLIAVFSVWSFTSWGVSFPQGGRAETPSIFFVMLLALFANAAIPRAFDADAWSFTLPFLLCLVGQTVFALITAEADWLRVHYRAMLLWTLVEAALWITGALVDPDARLAWWAGAAVLNVVGAWAGHPLPGRRFRSQEVRFEPARMVERSRLFLLIALGECVLTIGTAIAETELTAARLATAALGLVSTVMLWFLYFRSSDQVVNRSAESAADPLRVARIAVNSQLVVLAGLVALAVANETAIERPDEPTGIALAVALHAGPVLYLAAQTWYLHALSAVWSGPRIIGIAVLLAALPLSAIAVPLSAVLLVTVVLVAVVLAAGGAARTDSPSKEGST